MPETGPTVVLPGRPLTIGETLDSAVLLLRGQAALLIPLAAALAAGEQLLLLPLRDVAGATPPLWWAPSLSAFAPFWVLLSVGAATEAMIILLLGNPAARAAGNALLGQRTTARELLRAPDGRWGSTVGLCALVGAVMLFLSLIGPTWLVGFALLGAVAPALVIDRVAPSRAIRRSATLALRVDGRGAALRVLGYLVWWILRVGLGWGLLTALSTLGLVSDRWAAGAAMLVWAMVNAGAYAALACLDAVVHLETRIRSEGLDIHLSRAATPRTPADLLAVGG
ncbi:hypothetical protein [Micromonospora sp. LOL_024]|uniref:hypothetical protein n=1 Tax=Micromonospora sp. LOL_024 TaxID=3345412 RepID=UPI003A898331